MKIKRSRQNWFVMLGVFVAVFLFAFLAQKFNVDDEVDAANMAGFDAGYIMSDYQMGNYTSMNEAQIQAFLKSKNSCNDTRTYLTGNNVGHLSESTPYSWHVAGGHYVCMADESFNGESAAHIIWQAAQDYRINPQVLIVLLQKEQGLVTDTLPNSVQYRSAMGYGCPDTAACSSKYYGFRNQVRNAAALFRTVLDGGWTNYPLGNNYVRYSPNAACGGTIVNIRSRATSALYRYTPYQPNAAALSSSYGGGDGCSAYGNRNFYSYFEDWFGGITGEGFVWMDTPRYMTDLETGEIKYYRVKRIMNGGLCLGESFSSTTCRSYAKLATTSWDWEDMVTPRYLTGSSGAISVNLSDKNLRIPLADKTVYYTKKTILPNGTQCLMPEDTTKYDGWCAVFETLEDANLEEVPMQAPRVMETSGKAAFIDPVTKKILSYVGKGESFMFTEKKYLPDFGICLITAEKGGCIMKSEMSEVWSDLEFEREMTTKEDTYKIDVDNDRADKGLLVVKGTERRFLSKIFYGDDWCLRTEYDDNLNNNSCIPMSELDEMWNELQDREKKTIKVGARKIDATTLSAGLVMSSEEERLFVERYYVNQKKQWCYKTEYDANLLTNYCFLEDVLK